MTVWLCDSQEQHLAHNECFTHPSTDPSLGPGLKFKVSLMSNQVNITTDTILQVTENSPPSQIIQKVGNESLTIPKRSLPGPPHPHPTHFIYTSLIYSMMVHSFQKTTAGWLLPQSMYEWAYFFLPPNMWRVRVKIRARVMVMVRVRNS